MGHCYTGIVSWRARAASGKGARPRGGSGSATAPPQGRGRGGRRGGSRPRRTRRSRTEALLVPRRLASADHPRHRLRARGAAGDREDVAAAGHDHRHAARAQHAEDVQQRGVARVRRQDVQHVEAEHGVVGGVRHLVGGAVGGLEAAGRVGLQRMAAEQGGAAAAPGAVVEAVGADGGLEPGEDSVGLGVAGRRAGVLGPPRVLRRRKGVVERHPVLSRSPAPLRPSGPRLRHRAALVLSGPFRHPEPPGEVAGRPQVRSPRGARVVARACVRG